MPVMVFMSVDLPAPLSPTRPTTSPAADLEIDAVQHVDGAEALADLLEDQQGHTR